MRHVSPTIIQFKISESDLPAFLAYLGLGTLYAIQSSAVPAEIGIWTLARPKLWEPMNEHPNISQELIRVFQTADELVAIRELLPEQFNDQIKELIRRLQIELGKIGTPTWSIDWSVQPVQSNSHAPTDRKQKDRANKKTTRRQRK